MNKIHPTTIIGKNVFIGDNNEIGPYSIIEDDVIIGNNNYIGSHVVIGCQPTDTKNIKHDQSSNIIIGNNNIIREYCLVEKPCYEDKTLIKHNTFLMQGVHVSHDCIIDDYAVITNQTVLGGIAKILEGANVGMGVTINQYTIIGQYSIAATNSAVMRNIRPFSRYIPNKPKSVNYYAIKKYNFAEYVDEIVAYVMENAKVTSPKLVEIINIFDNWVAKYGHETY
ncbi:Acyl-[acyl-carrier-protein]--UDP-N-acetylglucosamine O-acyltransferase [Bacteroidales bacterium CF]|jgi:Acyl-[acyl carrier protein]--UDP-N-acetylglucosamine O-acyltransferase|nr:Acyl-[acyl-carrier-protein]--UDP-N-acetylglucosamine O-acyltransferase [Bacteroidales bacterium CF]